MEIQRGNQSIVVTWKKTTLNLETLFWLRIKRQGPEKQGLSHGRTKATQYKMLPTTIEGYMQGVE